MSMYTWGHISLKLSSRQHECYSVIAIDVIITVGIFFVCIWLLLSY